MKYIASLDGIRAVAIMAVLLFHIWPNSLRGGFVGVDIFFVLSGFLITSIIADDVREGQFSFKEFYLRRVQRLLPNAILTVVGTVSLWALFLPSYSTAQPATHGLWTLFNLSNIYAWRALDGYWGEASEWAPLTHFWSLGVEEQFYLLFPASLLLLVRYQFGRVQVWMTALCALSFILCIYATYTHPWAAFNFLPTRLWELLMGAVLAINLGKKWHGLLSVGGALLYERLAWMGCGLILLSFFLVDRVGRFPGYAALFPTAGTVCLIAGISATSVMSRLLSSRFFAGTGKLSYSLYLWHWPLIVFGRTQAERNDIPVLIGAAAGGLLAIPVSWVAYTYVEKPLRGRGPGRSWRLAVIALAFVLACVYCAFLSRRKVEIDPEHRFERPQFFGKLYDAGRTSSVSEASRSIRFMDVDMPVRTTGSKDAWRNGGIIHDFGAGKPEIVVLGSSHALMYSHLIDEICRELKISVAFLGVDQGTPAFFETTLGDNFSSLSEAREFDETRKKYIREWHPKVVFAIDRWDRYAETLVKFDERLRSFLSSIGKDAGTIVLVTQVPVINLRFEENLRALAYYRPADKDGFPRLTPEFRDDFRLGTVAAALTVANEFPALRVLQAHRLFYNLDGSVHYAEGRNFFYTDNNHLTEAGTQRVHDLFFQAISEGVTGN